MGIGMEMGMGMGMGQPDPRTGVTAWVVQPEETGPCSEPCSSVTAATQHTGADAQARGHLFQKGI